MGRFIKIGEAAKLLGVSIKTLRRWEEEGELLPDKKSPGLTRYYDIDRLLQQEIIETNLTLAYARVSSKDQREDLKRQAECLSIYCMKQGWQYEIIEDLGVSCLATLFDGKDTQQIIGPKPLKRLLSKLKRLQRALSRKQKGSRNRQKMRDNVAKLHAKIRCIRQDALHKLTTYLCRHYKTIVIEDLNVKGMMGNHKLARHIADMGFYECRRQLEYKAMLYGNTIHVVDRWFPSSKRCSGCLEMNTQLTLSDRIFSCIHCGLQLDRDENAARNLFSTVSSTGFEACGEESAGLGIS